MSETNFNNPFTSVQLKRIPHRKKETLRAWDAADNLLLQELANYQANLQKGIVVVNDAFGALAVALHDYLPQTWSDSWVSHQAMRENYQLNSLDAAACTTIDSIHAPKSTVHTALIKVPKSMALFQDQLLKLKPQLTKETIVLVAGMMKYMPKQVWQLLETVIGETKTHLAVKKAKLIEVSVNDSLKPSCNPYPVNWKLENTNFQLINHANVFSRESLDIGTRFLLQHMPDIQDNLNVIDLACGNGIVGLIALKQNPTAKLLCVDESYMAIASAKQNLKQLDPALKAVKFHVGDGLHKVKKQSADIILCNPPFHQHHAVGESLALSMFSKSAKVLRRNGELWVVSNRHLGYHAKLQTWFHDVRLIASNKKFVVLKASQAKR